MTALRTWRGVVAELLVLEEDVGAEDVLEAGLEAGPLVEEGLEEDEGRPFPRDDPPDLHLAGSLLF